VSFVDDEVLTALHAGAEGGGYLDASKMQMEAGAKPNSRMVNGSTPLFLASEQGQLDAVKLLFRAKAKPL